ncbi:MAG: hypothetical protein RLZ44_613 [Pseudomonadota bacterium]|jgi:hypothetical protein
MPQMILNRKHRYISLEGNSVAFEKGTPAFVPPNLVSYALSIGAEFVSDAEESKYSPKAMEQRDLPPIPRGDDRRSKIKDIMRQMRERNHRDDFTASGLPNAKTLTRVLGFEVDVKERNETWEEVLADIRAEADQ